MLSSRQYPSDTAYTIIIGFFLMDILLYLSNVNVLCDTISYNNISNQIKPLTFTSAVDNHGNLQHSFYNNNNSKNPSSRLTSTYYYSIDNNIAKTQIKTTKKHFHKDETNTNDNDYSVFSYNFSTVTSSPLSSALTNTDYLRTSNFSHYNQLCNLSHQSPTKSLPVKIIDSKNNEKNKISIVSSTSFVDSKKNSQFLFVNNKVNETNFINLTTEKYNKRHRRHLINDDKNKSVDNSGKNSSSSSDNSKNISIDDNLAAANNVVVETLTTIIPTTISSTPVNILAESNIVSTIIDVGDGDSKTNNNNGEYMIDIGDTFGAYENVTCTDESCINHNITCMGDPIYCNYTYEEYVEMLYDYIYPTIPEWILIASHAVVFFMGLVSRFEFKN